jgi:hypothetical protein
MPCADDYQEQNGQETPGRRVKGRKVARFENDSRERNRQTYRHTCGTKCPFNGLSTNHDRWGPCRECRLCEFKPTIGSITMR